jgi:glycosyltransferase involved in cell wall biosynthesis
VQCTIICRGLGLSSEAWLYRQVVGLRRLTVQVIAYAHENQGEYPANGFPVHIRRPSSPAGRLRRQLRRLHNQLRGVGDYRGGWAEAKWLCQHLREPRQDVVLAQYGPTGMDLLPICKAMRIPLVVHFHGFDLSKFLATSWYVRRLQRSLPAFAACVCVASYQRDWLLAQGVSPERLHLIPCGAPMSTLAEARSVAQQPCRFIMVGRLTEKKRPDLSIRAFARCAQEVPDVSLTIIGAGEMREECEALIRKLGVAERVTILGSQPNEGVREELARSSVFVQHSVTAKTGDKEGWPVSIAEAAGTGLPVVATRHAGIVDQVDEGQTGLLVDEGDWEGMAKHMLALARSPDLRTRMGQAGRIKMSQFDVAIQVSKLENVLLQAAEGS